MQVEAIPLTDFVHNHIDAHEGRPIVPWIEESLARQLEQAGLVRIRLAHAKPVEGKPQDDGQGQPSSVSPVAPASPMTMSTPSARGPGRPRKNAA